MTERSSEDHEVVLGEGEYRPSVNWIEHGSVIFTINFFCPHCGKSLAIEISKVEMVRKDD